MKKFISTKRRLANNENTYYRLRRMLDEAKDRIEEKLIIEGELKNE